MLSEDMYTDIAMMSAGVISHLQIDITAEVE